MSGVLRHFGIATSPPEGVAIMSMEDKLWFYRAKILRIIDGDTIVCQIDAGFGFTYSNGGKGVHVRLLGINAPEMKTEAGKLAKAHLESILSGVDTLYLRTEKPDDFGRLLATVYIADETNICDQMIRDGHAVVFTI